MRRNEQAGQYELVVDDQVVSVIGYEVRDGTTALLFTATEPEFRGRGHATALAAAVLQELRDDGTPFSTGCRFVRAYLVRQPAAPSPATPAADAGPTSPTLD